jgi:hypothetical protein
MTQVMRMNDDRPEGRDVLDVDFGEIAKER